MSAAADYLPRDYVETDDGLLFAVLGWDDEDGRIPAFLRYVRDGGSLRKLATGEAAERVLREFPHYSFHSALRDIDLHGVPFDRIRRHYRPVVRTRALASQPVQDVLEARAARALALLTSGGVAEEVLGITGSLLLGAHRPDSDVDLVVYDRDGFGRARQVVREAISSGMCEGLDAARWREAFDRRACSLTLEEYVWHERRKHNKFVIEGSKIDISLVSLTGEPAVPWRKTGQTCLRARVSDDTAGFDYPARLLLDHPDIPEVVSYTTTFTGQARRGEFVFASGWVEESPQRGRRLVVGTSREAGGEFIKVVRG